VALLLWGLHMVQSGVQRAYGAHLRQFLEVALGSRLKAVLAGLGVTAVLQSSTATGLMAASFASSGLVSVVPALAVMLGANVGTTLIVQVLSFDVGHVAPLFVLAGVLMFRRGGTARTRDLGRVAIGLGLMLFALSRLLELLVPYEDAPSLRMMLGVLTTDRIVAALAAAALTWLAHSSVAVVLLVMSLAHKGVVPLEAALAMVAGANLGSALNPLLESGSAGDVAGRRVAVGNLINRLVGCAIAIPLLAWIGPLLVTWQPDLSRAVADFHTAFNVVLALLFLPLLDPMANLLRRLLPTRIEAADPAKPVHLDPSALETPAIALGHAAREALRMVDVLETMLRGAVDSLDTQDRGRIAEVRRTDDVLDSLDRAIKTYVTGLDIDDMSKADHRRAAAILTFSTNLEHAGDILDKNVMALATKRLKRGVGPTSGGRDRAREMLGRLDANLRAAASVFVTEDVRAARHLADEKTVFRDLEAEAIEDHFRSLRSRKPGSAEAQSPDLDLLRDLKRINDHLVSGAAYPVLQSQGELLSSRLRPPDPGEDAADR
jgi:phosphate:Na+ symporter